jgi:hypothetical protein
VIPWLGLQFVAGSVLTSHELLKIVIVHLSRGRKVHLE